MRAAVFALSAMFLVSTAAPARAQLGALGKIKKAADQAADAKKKYDDYNITEQEERQLGEQVSAKLREHFGVYQDQAVTKYVSLVGSVLAQESTRPKLDWKFIVLDTEGVNAYAAPGGFVHITKGLLGLIKNEAELAGVLGHEITHVTKKHTVSALQREKKVSLTTDELKSAGNPRVEFLTKMGTQAYDDVFDGKFSREDEGEADDVGVALANKVGYSPRGMVDVLKKIDERNGAHDERNGLFASHPVTSDRIQTIEKEIGAKKLTAKATVEQRYKQYITFDARPITEISADVEGASGLLSGDKKKDDDKKTADADKNKSDKDKKDADKDKKSGFGLSSITGTKQAKANQQTASAGARGVSPDRDAKGGPNKNALAVRITSVEIDVFKKGIVS
jgi:predicted Zn-dependent protease